jgi:hypothetical protein
VVKAWRDGDLLLVDGALAALEASVALIRAEDRPVVADGAGRRIPLAGLMRAARRDAADPAGEQRLNGVLADYLEAQRDSTWRSAHDRYTDLTSADTAWLLQQAEERGEPVADWRQANAEEIEGLKPTVFGSRAWRTAGRDWAWEFRTDVPEATQAELTHRHGDGFSAHDLSEGVRAGLDRIAEWRRADRAAWAARAVGLATTTSADPVSGAITVRTYKP